MDFRGVIAYPPVTVEILNVGGLQIAPAILMDHAASHIQRLVAALHAVLNITLHGAERAAGGVGFRAMVAEPILQGDIERAAKGVEAEHRVGAFDVEFTDCHVRDQIPIYGIAERLVEPNAVDVNRDTLRGALQRRHLKPVIKERWLIRVAGGAIQVDAGHLSVQGIEHIRVAIARDGGTVQHLRIGRHQVAVHAGAEQRRGADDRNVLLRWRRRWRGGLSARRESQNKRQSGRDHQACTMGKLRHWRSVPGSICALYAQE